jgi:hypothetical protein
MFEQRDATAVDSVDQGMPTEPTNSWAAACAALGVAVLLLLDLLTTRELASWKTHAVLEVGAAFIALGFFGRSWLRGSRVAARPSARAYEVPRLLLGPPHIDHRLWAEIRAAIRAECASTPVATPLIDRSGPPRNGGEPAPRYSLALAQPPRRNERRERRAYRRSALSRA